MRAGPERKGTSVLFDGQAGASWFRPKAHIGTKVTQQCAVHLGAKVTSVGWHSGVKVTCEA